MKNSKDISLTEALKYPVHNPAQGKSVSHKALKLSISGLKPWVKKNLSLVKFKRLPKRTCCHDARFKHGYPALLPYHIISHLGTSCSNIVIFDQREHSVTTLLTRLSCSNIGVFDQRGHNLWVILPVYQLLQLHQVILIDPPNS